MTGEGADSQEGAAIATPPGRPGPWLNLELRFIAAFSLLFLVIFLLFITTMFIGLPGTAFTGWLGHEREQAALSLAQLADMQKQHLLETLNSHRPHVRILAGMKELGEAVAGVIQAPPGQEAARLGELERVLLPMAGHHAGSFRTVHLVRLPTGLVLASSRSGMVGRSLADALVVQGVNTTGEDYVAYVRAGEGVPRSVVQVAAVIPAPGGKTPRAALIMESTLDELFQPYRFNTRGPWRSALTLVLDEGGRVLFSSPTPGAAQEEPATFWQDLLARLGGEGLAWAEAIPGKPELIAYRSLRLFPEWSLNLVVRMDEAELFAPVVFASRFFLGMGGISLLLFLALTVTLTRQLAQPLRHLTRVAGDIARGRRHVRSGIHRRDEIGLLASTFDSLMAHQEAIQDDLEQRVAERTVALSHELETRRRAEAQLRESEGRLQAILDNSSAVIFIKDWQGHLLLTNRGYRHFFDDAEAAGELLAPESCLRERHEAVVRECEVALPASRATFIVVKFPLPGPGGESYAWCGMATDVTSHKRMERQLLQAQKMESMGTLASGIAHDFNNILAVIMGNCELLQWELPQEGILARRLAEMLRATERGRDLVGQILAFSRPGNREKQRLLLPPLIKETMKFLRATLPAQVELATHIRAVSASLADPVQIQQVLMNLCTNASQALGAEGGVIRVELTPCRLEDNEAAELGVPSGAYNLLEVADTGTGMAPEVLERIFEPFFTTKPPGQGTGLGLAQVHGMVQAHGGVVKVMSALGQGSRFQVWLPAIDQATDEPVATALPTGEAGHARLLLVDDDPGLLDVLRESLRRYRVTACRDPREAWALFQEQPFDLVLTDQNMPGMTGQELAARVRGVAPGCPVILLTGFSQGVTPVNYQELGFAAYLEKPVRLGELLGTLRKFLASARPSA